MGKCYEERLERSALYIPSTVVRDIFTEKCNYQDNPLTNEETKALQGYLIFLGINMY